MIMRQKTMGMGIKMGRTVDDGGILPELLRKPDHVWLLAVRGAQRSITLFVIAHVLLIHEFQTSILNDLGDGDFQVV